MSSREAHVRRPKVPLHEPSPPALEPLPLSALFLRYLKAEGIRHVFGIPGGLLHPFFEAVERDADIDLVVAKHECGAAFMADGYARTSGRLAVVAATAGPGATNLLTGVGVAFSDGVPMIVLTGQPPSHALGKGAAQEMTREDIDVVAMFRPITKYSTMVTAPGQFAHHLRRAVRLARSGRPGPVHLNVPVDLWGQLVKDDRGIEPATYRADPRLFDRAEVARAAAALVAAERPVFLVGSGAADASARAALAELAELLPARVATSPRAKGLFAEDHPLSLGVFGFAGHDEARATLTGDAIDLLFTIGASLNETTTLNWHPALNRNRTFVQLDIDVDRVGRNYAVDIPLVGDAATVLHELGHHVRRAAKAAGGMGSTWHSAPPLPVGHARFSQPETRLSTARPLRPERWRAEMCAALPDDAMVFSDIGGHMLFNVHHLTIRRQQRFVLNLGFGSMGHGTAAPVGAALAQPGRPVVAIIGDACFTMTGMELLTAREYDVPVVWIVENNQMHGITWHGSKRVGNGEPMQSIVYRRPLDIAGMARAMGLEVFVVDAPDQIVGALGAALATRRPAVIDVHIDPLVSPPLGDRAKTVAGFRNE